MRKTIDLKRILSTIKTTKPQSRFKGEYKKNKTKTIFDSIVDLLSNFDTEKKEKRTCKKLSKSKVERNKEIFNSFFNKSFQDSRASFTRLLKKIINLDGVPDDIAKGKIVYKASALNHNRNKSTAVELDRLFY